MRLPYPPVLNHYLVWFCTRARKGDHHAVRSRLTEEAVQYHEAVRMTSIVQRVMPTDQPVRVTIHAYRPRPAGDLDGALKVLLDALEGCLYLNDRQIVEIHAYRHDDFTDPRVEVEVEQVAEIEEANDKETHTERP